MNRFMLIVTVVAATCGFLYGYDTGIVSGALMSIAHDFSLGHTMQEAVAASILAGALIGGLSSGWFSDRYGRRIAILMIAVIFVIGAAASALAPSATTLALARVFLGLAVGAASQSAPIYIAELAPAEHRGNLVTAFNVAIGVGIMTASLVGYFLHGVVSWRYMIGGATVPAAFLLLSMFRLPETPRWLASRHRTEEAREALRRVRREDADIDKELAGIEAVTRRTEQSDTRGWRGLWADWVRPATICGLGVAAFTQLSGIEMMIYYAPTILKGAGFGPESALLSGMGIAAVYLSMTAAGLMVVDRIGRRHLSLMMIPGAALALAVLGALFILGMGGSGHAWLLVGCILVFMAFNSGGLQVVGWLTGSEVYPLALRGAGTSAQAGMVWGSDLVVTATALTLVHLLGNGGTMWIYALMNVLAFVFIWYCVPETAGHSLEDIERALREGRFRPALGYAPDQEMKPASG